MHDFVSFPLLLPILHDEMEITSEIKTSGASTRQSTRLPWCSLNSADEPTNGIRPFEDSDGRKGPWHLLRALGTSAAVGQGLRRRNIANRRPISPRGGGLIGAPAGVRAYRIFAESNASPQFPRAFIEAFQQLFVIARGRPPPTKRAS
ncbi:uncharacterized protein CLUP02_07189 [Colletotrichum lupini]|uniref:Uncharacterized protein n=1 Tax=Colletotrichum lupini TaxID=145971 RepID=A0A9Q8SQQ3_9PEZI|nr:uncharacterized protein CLUP02_07189 [Colletotrichum lupini]UQC81703.1 hypothetical protein CLUP02_07189 [Colletotrichum lupini]